LQGTVQEDLILNVILNGALQVFPFPVMVLAFLRPAHELKMLGHRAVREHPVGGANLCVVIHRDGVQPTQDGTTFAVAAAPGQALRAGPALRERQGEVKATALLLCRLNDEDIGLAAHEAAEATEYLTVEVPCRLQAVPLGL